jgi:urease accessory protein
MMFIEAVLGNRADPAWRARLEGMTIDYLTLDQWEAQKNRFRKRSRNGVELAVSLDREMHLRDGDVLVWDRMQSRAIVARIQLQEVMVVQLGELLKSSPEQMLQTCIELGHAIGNQHWPAVIKGTQVFIPLTVDRRVMAAVMKTHALPAVTFQFVPGEEVILYLAPHEARRLFGGAEQEHTHGLTHELAEGGCDDHH